MVGQRRPAIQEQYTHSLLPAARGRYQRLESRIDDLRNIPDVAAEANTNQYSCYDGSCSGGNGGTSYAAPQWAAFTAPVNQQAAANGKPTVGFLNPTLYSIGVGSSYESDFHDITSGSNGKYSAVNGYDLVTGWGSANGSNLINSFAP